MNGSHDDVRWVRAQRPAVDPPDPAATDRARAALLAHASGAARIAPAVAAPQRARRRPRIAVLARPRRAVAGGLVAAAVVAAAFAVAPGGRHTAISPAVAGAQSLVLLADRVAAAPLHGDATLVYHRNVIAGRGSFTGADLYLDGGRYYYAATPGGLPAAVRAGPQPDFSLEPILTAMASATTADPRAARTAYLKAVDPLYGGDVQHEARSKQDNVIWVSAIDVLGAAYGRPAVLAGTLRVLSTVHGVKVARSTLHGVRTLEIAMWVPKETADVATLRRALAAKLRAAGRLDRADATAKAKLGALKAQGASVHRTSTPAHWMRATLDARTGAFLRYTDIGLVVTYHVSRVDASRYGAR